MKKLLSLMLALAVALGLALPSAAAEESADAALARVTQAVKDTLALDTTGYDQFQGDRYEDGLTGVWSLRWDGAEGSLSVDTLDDGTVTGYYLGENYTAPSNGFPTFPQGDADAAAQAARAFLDRVLAEGESVELEEPQGMDSSTDSPSASTLSRKARAAWAAASASPCGKVGNPPLGDV